MHMNCKIDCSIGFPLFFFDGKLQSCKVNIVHAMEGKKDVCFLDKPDGLNFMLLGLVPLPAHRKLTRSDTTALFLGLEFDKSIFL